MRVPLYTIQYTGVYTIATTAPSLWHLCMAGTVKYIVIKPIATMQRFVFLVSLQRWIRKSFKICERVFVRLWSYDIDQQNILAPFPATAITTFTIHIHPPKNTVSMQRKQTNKENIHSVIKNGAGRWWIWKRANVRFGRKLCNSVSGHNTQHRFSLVPTCMVGKCDSESQR